MTLHLFNKAIPMARLSPQPAPPQETPLPPALAAILDHPIMFVTTVWIVFYVAMALMP
jgi:hypothetical protein